MRIRYSILFLFIISICSFICIACKEAQQNEQYVTYTADPKTENIRFYWKDKQGERFGSIKKLKDNLTKQNKELVFAMNGGMYSPQKSPLGLFIDKNVEVTPINTQDGNGNFYLKPNGIFYIPNKGNAKIVSTEKFKNNGAIQYATQSGPMLLINGDIHQVFRKGSANLQIRNGVGILPDGKIIFAMSKGEVNFYDFAEYFRAQGCKNALYLDGFVSRTYLPEENWTQTDGDFGVIIGITK